MIVTRVEPSAVLRNLGNTSLNFLLSSLLRIIIKENFSLFDPTTVKKPLSKYWMDNAVKRNFSFTFNITRYSILSRL